VDWCSIVITRPSYANTLLRGHFCVLYVAAGVNSNSVNCTSKVLHVFSDSDWRMESKNQVQRSIFETNRKYIKRDLRLWLNKELKLFVLLLC
jgi:5-methylcytosine-specific restriction endonuclease McrA